MRRTAMVMVAALGLAVLPLVATPPVSASLSLPSGFMLLDYPTGQAPYNLTEFAWLENGGLLTAGKDGTITFVPPGGTPRVVATVPGVRVIGDHGLLGFAPANDYAATGHVYLTYDKGDAAGTGFGMVEQWTMSPAANPTSFTHTKTLVDGRAMSPQLAESGYTHSIDSVVVAPDDSLFVSVGENALNNGDPQTLRSQDLAQPYGKLFHLTPDGLGAPTNPFYSALSPGSWRSMVYAYGLRNPFRFSLDPRSGIPTVGDVGWNTTEEVDTLSPGANAGWPCYEGNARTTFSSYAVCKSLYDAGSVRLPIWTYPHAGANASVVGGMFYTGTSYPAIYANSWFFGDYTRAELWTLATDTAGRLTRAPEAAGFALDAGSPVSFHPGPNGDVTYADLTGGTVRRLVYSPGNRAPVAAFTTTNDPATRTVTYSAADSYDLDGDTLTYSWAFGDGATGTGRTTNHTFASDNPVTTTLTVTDPLGATDTSTATIHPANHTPVLTLTTPAPRTYAVDDDVHLTASATDSEDGALTVSWRTVLRHCPFAGSCHVHPGETGTGAAYDEPFTDHGSDTEMLVTAQATDSAGAVASETYLASPTLRTVAVTSPVAVAINGTTAFTAQAVVGSDVQVNAPVSSSYWSFTKWSDNGAAAHSFTMPGTDQTLTATYTTAIDKKYAALGGAASLLGAAAGVEYDLSGGRARNYSNGRIYWSGASGAHESHGKILAKYLALGGPAGLGWPTSDELAVTGGRASYYGGGRIYYSAATQAHVLRSSVLAKYLAVGGPAGYGLPTTDLTTVTGGNYAHFTGSRSIFWSSATAAHLVVGAIRARYAAMGYQRSCLGFPKGEQYAITGGTRQVFAHGTITHTTKTGQTTASC